MQTECGVPGPWRPGPEAQGAGSRDPCAWTCVYMCARCHLCSIPLDEPEPGSRIPVHPGLSWALRSGSQLSPQGTRAGVQG